MCNRNAFQTTTPTNVAKTRNQRDQVLTALRANVKGVTSQYLWPNIPAASFRRTVGGLRAEGYTVEVENGFYVIYE